MTDEITIQMENHCVSCDQGEQVFNSIRQHFNNSKHVKLNFENVELLTGAFLSVAIGRLYEAFSEKFIAKSLKFEKISYGDRVYVKAAIREAKLYNRNPAKYKKRMKWVKKQLEFMGYD